MATIFQVSKVQICSPKRVEVTRSCVSNTCRLQRRGVQLVAARRTPQHQRYVKAAAAATAEDDVDEAIDDLEEELPTDDEDDEPVASVATEAAPPASTDSTDIKFSLNFLWMEKNIGVAVDQVFAKDQRSPVTEYYFWPTKDAWEELKVALESKAWISEIEKVLLLNRTTEVINFWQVQEGDKPTVKQAREQFPDSKVVLDGHIRLGAVRVHRQYHYFTDGNLLTTWTAADVVKVRLQLQSIQWATTGGATVAQPPPGLLMTGVNLVRHEGLLALYRGINPAVARGLFYGGVRLGCYRPLKELLGATKENNSMVRNIAAGSLSGALAAWASNPIDLIKTRLQSKDNPQRTSGAVVKHILKEEGLRGLWRGTVPSTARAAVLTAAQCATYDESKKIWMSMTGGGDTPTTHIGASMITGLVTTLLTAPVDVIKTNMFVGGSRYSGPLHCATDIIKREGMRGLLKGWSANYVRLGPQTTVIFVVTEKLRQLHGMDAL